MEKSNENVFLDIPSVHRLKECIKISPKFCINLKVMQPELLFFLHLQKLFAENFVQAGAEVQNVYVGNLANLNIYVATFT